MTGTKYGEYVRKHDLQIGGYDWKMMAVVYGMLALPVALRGALRRWGDVAPGKTVVGRSTIHIFRGNAAEFVKRCEAET